MMMQQRVTRKDVDPERAMLRSMLVVSMRDAASLAQTPRGRRVRENARDWIEGRSNGCFCFDNVVTYLYGVEADSGPLRNGIMRVVGEHGARSIGGALAEVDDDGSES